MKKALGLFIVAVFAIVSGFAAEATKPGLPKTGVNLERDGGGWLNVVVNSSDRFVLSFFNDKKEQVPSDVHHGLVRYAYTTKAPGRTAVRLSPDGKTLVSPEDIVPPHDFRVNLALFNAGPEDLVETYAFFYHGP